MIDNKSLHSQP